MVGVAGILGVPAAAVAAPASAGLTAGRAVGLAVPSHDVLAVAEAPNGAVFFAPQPVIGEKGAVRHAKAAEVVRVVDGDSAPTVAEHTHDPVLALAAGTKDLFVVTTTHVVTYRRSTGARLRSLPLPTTSTFASATLTSGWLYVDSAYECDYCGYEPSTLSAIDLHSHATHTVSTDAAPGAVAARGDHVYYGLISGHVVATTATARTNRHAATSPQVGISLVGSFGNRLVTYGLAPDATKPAVWLLDPHSLTVRSTRRIPSADAYDVVETSHGPVMSSSTCPQQLAASQCRSSDVGALGHRVSRLDLTTGRTSQSVTVGNVDRLVGPRPAAITVADGHYRLVRIA